MNDNIRDSMIAEYEARIADFDADGADLSDTEKESRAKAMATLDALKAEKAMPEAPAVPKELTDRVELRRYVQAAIAGESKLDGAEAELNQQMELADHLVPLSLLDKPLEVRADTNTTIAAGEFDTNLQRVIIPPFAGSDLAHLGLSPTRLPNGQRRIPIMTATGAVATAVAKSANVDADDATITVIDFNAREIRKRFRYSYKETFEWGNALDSSLVDVLRMALAERLDDMALIGSGSNNEPTGIFASLTEPGNPTGEAGFDDYVAAPSGQIDGKYTNAESGMAILVGIPTWKHARTKRQTASGIDALSGLRELGVSARASSRVAAIASKRQDALLALSPVAARSAYFVGVWEAFRLIRDEATYSANGDIALTATLYYDAKELLDGGIKRVRFQVQA